MVAYNTCDLTVNNHGIQWFYYHQDRHNKTLFDKQTIHNSHTRNQQNFFVSTFINNC